MHKRLQAIALGLLCVAYAIKAAIPIVGLALSKAL